MGEAQAVALFRRRACACVRMVRTHRAAEATNRERKGLGGGCRRQSPVSARGSRACRRAFGESLDARHPSHG